MSFVVFSAFCGLGGLCRGVLGETTTGVESRARTSAREEIHAGLRVEAEDRRDYGELTRAPCAQRNTGLPERNSTLLKMRKSPRSASG